MMVTQPYSTEIPFAERMGIAHEAGKKAKRDGLPLSACPHEEGTPAYVEWRNGWEEAIARKRRAA